MSFEARVYIQGVGVYVPQKEAGEAEAKKMHVLFPNYDKAYDLGVRDAKGNPVCRHYAVVQFSARCLERRLVQDSDSNAESSPLSCFPDAWTTIDLSGMWLEFTAQPAESAGRLEPRLTRNGRIPGLPYLPDVLRQQVPLSPAGGGNPPDLSIHPKAKSVDGSEAELLKAGLIVEAGVLSPYAEYEGLYRFPVSRQNGSNQARRGADGTPNPGDQKLSSVLKIELGEVESFTLHFRPFGTDRAFDVPLQPPSDQEGVMWDELDIWVRHFCELDRPDPDGRTAEPDEEDEDFVLNYMLLENLPEVLKACGNVLPVPRVSSSWARGGLIGSEARKCMGAQA